MDTGNAIGIIELCSLFKGYEVQDHILKSEYVEKLMARSICSGKYIILVRGKIADVEQCLDSAREVGGFAIVSATMIPRVHEEVFSAMSESNLLETEEVDGLAIIETFSVASAIKGADFAIKEANINILRLHIAMAIGGKGMIVLDGNIESLKSALRPAIEYIKEDGTLAGHTLLTNPHPDLLNDLL